MHQYLIDYLYEKRFVIIRWVLMLGAGAIVSCAMEHHNSSAADDPSNCDMSINCAIHKN